MNLLAIYHATQLVLASGGGELAGAFFAVLFVLLHIVNGIKKQRDKRKPPIIRHEEPPVPRQQNESPRPMRRMPTPAPRPQRPVQPRPSGFQRPAPMPTTTGQMVPQSLPPQRSWPPQAPTPGWRVPPPIVFKTLRPAPPAIAPAPPSALPAPIAQTVSPVAALTPARPQPAAAASIHRWLTPQTLRSQFILTEVFQPPLGMRQNPFD